MRQRVAVAVGANRWLFRGLGLIGDSRPRWAPVLLLLARRVGSPGLVRSQARARGRSLKRGGTLRRLPFGVNGN